MYLPKIEEFFDIRFFYLDESFLINIKGLIGLTDLASVFADNLSRRIPYELQRRTREILENNLMMVQEKITNPQKEEEVVMEDEIKLQYEKSLKFHLEIVYECVNLIYKQMAIVKKFAFQKTEFLDFSYKQFLLVKRIVESVEEIVVDVNSVKKEQVDVKKEQVDVNSVRNEDKNIINSPTVTSHSSNPTLTSSTPLLIKSTFLSLSKPLKEIADGFNDLLKGGSTEIVFPTEDLFSTFQSILNILEVVDFNEKDSQFVNEIVSFFFTPFGGTILLDIIHSLLYQMFRVPKTLKIYLGLLKKCSNVHLQVVVNETVYQLVSMLVQEKNRVYFKKRLYAPEKLSYPEMVDLYEPVFDFIADIYNYNSSLISKKSMYALVNFINRLISSQDIEDHRLLLFLLGTFNIKNDKAGSLHVFFYKKLHVFVRDFFSFYTQSLDPIYLDIIFSFPININAIASEWAFLLNPIRCALRLRDDISLKAISAFIHIVEASKGEIVGGSTVEELFGEIFDLLDDQRFTISCSQLLGRLKSFHKKHLTSSFFFSHPSLGDSVFLKPQGEDIAFPLDGVVRSAIDFLRGKTVADPERLIFNLEGVVTFKKTFPEVKKGKEEEESAFRILKEFILKEVKGCDRENVHKSNGTMCELGKEAGNVSFHPSTHTSVHPHAHPHAHSSLSSALLSSSPSHQLVYDSILALLCCSEEKAFPFLKDVFDSLDIFSHKIFLLSLLEGFGERQSSLTSKLFHRVLNKLLRNKESSPNAVFTSNPLSHNAVFSSILSYLLDLALSRNEKMSTASFNGLNSILMWESLPPKLILKHLKEILDGLICFVEKRKAFSKDFLQGLDFLIKRKDTLSCVSFIFKWAVDRISFSKASGRVEMAFCKEILKLLYLKYSKLFIAMFTEKLKGFFYALSDLRDVDLFYTKVDLFVFFVKNTRLFSEKETVVLVKTYFYYILSCNFFILNVSQDTFLTNLSIVSSPEYKEWEKEVLRKGDLIHHLFYELPQDNPHFYDVFDCSLNLPIDVSEEDKYSYYLVNEIVYMHLAFIKKKEVALAPFDIVFNSLPFGLSLPLKMLGMSNPLIKEMLLEKYEECFNSPLSVKVVERMLLIFSVIEMEEDEKLFNFILKIFEEGRTPVENILVSEEPENSIFSKTFELSLKYPNQTVLHMNILRVAYPWLYSSSRKYVEGILKALLDFVEQFPKLCFPLLVRECVEESVLFLVEYVLRNSIAFRNYVNNLSQGFIEESFKGAQEGGSSVNMNSSVHNSNVGVNIHNNSNVHNINNMNTRFKNSPQDRILIFLTFLRLIDYEVTPPQINTSIRLYGDLKLLNKDTKRVKDFFRFSINRFSENELNLLFKTDPLLKLTGSCNVKMFKSLSSKSLYGCLLKSINKKDIKSFENLIRFYGEQSWMLIEMFVEEKFYSTRMMEYCRQNLKNVNIRSYLLYYLCTFDPLPEYFPLLLGLSFEERKHTLYSLRKITEKYIHPEDSNLFAGPNLFEESILVYLKDEIQYKTNIHILYPLLSHTPSLLTPKIGRVLCGVVYRLFNTFVQFHQKIGSQLFDSLYIFYEKSSKDKDSKKENGSKDKDSTIDGKDITPTTHYSLTTHYPPTAPLQGLYNLLILNYFLSKKTCLLKKYNFLLDLESLRAPFPSESLELQNVISYLEMVIEKGKNEEIKEINKEIGKEKDDIHNANLHKNYITLNANLHKNTFPNEYLTKLVKFLFNVVRKSWFKFPLSLSTVEFLFPLITPKDFPHLCKEMHKSTFLNFLRVKSQSSVNWKHLLPFIKGVVQDTSQPHPFVFIFQIFCDFSLFLSNTSLFVSFVVGLVEKDYPSLHRTIYDVLLDVKTPPSLQIALLSSLYSKFLFVFKEEDVLNLSLSFFLKNRGAHPGVLTPLNEIFYRGCTHPLEEIREKYIQFLDSLLPRESFMRLKSLLEMDWTGCDLKRVPYIFITLLLEKYQEMKVSREGREMCMCSREGMKEVGVMEEEMMKEDSSGEEIGTSDKLKEACKDNVTSSTSLYFKRDLLDFLYVSPEASLSLLLEIVKFISCEDLEKEILELSPLVSDSLTYTLLKANAYKETHSCTHSTSPPYTPHSTTTHLPHLSFYFLLSKGNNNLLRYKEMGIKDYVYGCLRSSSKFPEVMQATVFQQVGKYKEALRIYEKLQGLCVEGRVSFYEEEYENILKEWVDSSKEMQQWDICYTLGKFKGDTTLSADSLFFTSNFNIQNEREAFSSMVSLMERGIKKSFYELFYTVYHTPSSESFVDLLIQIVRKMSTGPRTKEFNAYYSTLIQIVLEMHDTVSLFSFRPDTEERINGLAYAWEDREPLIEGPYEVLLLFSTWRRHFFRRVEGYSNETTLPGEQEVDNEVSKEGKDVKDSVSKDVSKDRNNTTVSSPTNPSPMSNPPFLPLPI